MSGGGTQNIIQDLQREIHRVEQLYPTLNGEELDKAKRTVAYAQNGLALNAPKVMKESLWDLRQITGKPK